MNRRDASKEGGTGGPPRRKKVWSRRFESRLARRMGVMGMVWLWLVQAPASARDGMTVLALGDSITQGGEGYPCYREFLKPDMEKGDLRFIGPNQDGISPHAGFGGRNSTWLRQRIQTIYKAHPADLVLIHAGHNHFAKDDPVPTVIADTEAIIGTIREINPEVVVFLAQVIPSGKLPKYSYLPELNQRLAGLAERLGGEERKLILVNQAEGFDWKTDTKEDKVHPNEAGARKMARQWWKAIAGVLGPPEAATP